VSVVVRPASPADAVVLAELSRAAIEASEVYTLAQRVAWASRRSVAAHLRFIEVTRVLVASVDGVVAGFASVALAPVDGLVAGEVDQLFVDPASGGRGVARALLSAVESTARSSGLASLVTHASWRAVPVFERAGFRQVEVESVTLDGEVLTRALMRKSLV
jgi:putative acetyltransferase